MLSLLRVGFFKRGETRADLKREGKEHSESNKMIIGVIRISMQSFPKLVGIGSRSHDLHGASRARRHTSSAVTRVGFFKTFLVWGFSTCECESEGKEAWMTEILFMENEPKVFARATVEEWSGRGSLGQRCKILLNAFYNYRWSPECSALE